ncbi:hypothetical protein PVAND_006382 [Polypedilum vanderplanki]|uniref:Uncharacterized protein n=1 Tax=Polypedilum vanderplanki TaxID=319348 RepID=A0A9J6C4R6_POLVA|nr:hypothetical protein PVAND_006382 [Polypedilum vanderplanki]
MKFVCLILFIFINSTFALNFHLIVISYGKIYEHNYNEGNKMFLVKLPSTDCECIGIEYENNIGDHYKIITIPDMYGIKYDIDDNLFLNRRSTKKVLFSPVINDKYFLRMGFFINLSECETNVINKHSAVGCEMKATNENCESFYYELNTFTYFLHQMNVSIYYNGEYEMHIYCEICVIHLELHNRIVNTEMGLDYTVTEIFEKNVWSLNAPVVVPIQGELSEN